MTGSSKRRKIVCEVITFIVGAAVIALSILYGFWTVQPTSEATKFDDKLELATTINHTIEISKEKHPSGSKANRAVQEYLVAQFEAMDVEYQEIPFNYGSRNYKDYLVKLDAPNTEEGVLFVSHYDSTNGGPGAADDAISAASMLTVINQVKTRGELTNDVYFLFTDGEEMGLIGATGFLNNYHEQYKDIFRFVVNLEARGNRGALIMFETAANDYNAVKALQKAVKSGSTPLSVAVALYKTMPNDTDFTVFLNKGYQGLNFAIVSGGENYHSEMDTVSNLDDDTAYMYLATTSELANYLEDCDLSQLTGSADGVYFPIAKGKFLLTSQTAMNVFAVLTIIFFIIMGVLAILKKKLSVKSILIGAGVFAGLCLITYLISNPVEQLGMSIMVNAQDPYELAKIKNTFFLNQMIVYVDVILVLYFVLRKFIGNRENHSFLFGLILAIATVAILIIFPEAVYVTCIPLFMLSVVLLVDLFWSTKFPLIGWVASVGLCLVVSIAVMPLMLLVFDSLGIFGPLNLVSIVLGLVETLTLSLCIGSLFTNKRVQIPDKQ